MSNTNRTVNPLVRLLVVAFAIMGLFGGAVLTAPAASASVYSSCTPSGCAEARDSNSIWASMGYPQTRGWYDWPDGQCNYAGGTYNNYEGELPANHSYLEYDVTPRACGAARQAYRLVVDRTAGTVYFSPDHYSNFYRL